MKLPIINTVTSFEKSVFSWIMLTFWLLLYSCTSDANGERPRAAPQTTGLNYNLRKDLSGKNKASPGFFFDPATGTFKQSIPVPVPTVPSKYKFDNSYSNNRRKQENDAENTYNNPLLTSTLFTSANLKNNGGGGLFGNTNFDYDTENVGAIPTNPRDKETQYHYDEYDYLYYDEDGEPLQSPNDDTGKREVGGGNKYRNSPGPQVIDNKEAAESIVYHSFNNPEDVILPTSSNNYLKNHNSKFKKVKTYDYVIGDDYPNQNTKDGKEDHAKNHRKSNDQKKNLHQSHTGSSVLRQPAKKKSPLVYDYTIGEDYTYAPESFDPLSGIPPEREEVYQLDKVHQYATTNSPFVPKFTTTDKYNPFDTKNVPLHKQPTRTPEFDEAYIFPTRKFPIYSVRPTTSKTTTITSKRLPPTTAPSITTWSPQWHPNAAETYNRFAAENRYPVTENSNPFSSGKRKSTFTTTFKPFLPTMVSGRKKPKFSIKSSLPDKYQGSKWNPEQTTRKSGFRTTTERRTTTTTTTTSTTTTRKPTTTTRRSTTTTRRPKPTRNKKFTTSATFRPRIPSKRVKDSQTTTPKYVRKIPRIIESAVGVVNKARKEIAKRYPEKKDEKFKYFPDLFAAGIEGGINYNYPDTYHHYESKRFYNQPAGDEYSSNNSMLGSHTEEEEDDQRQGSSNRGKQSEFNSRDQSKFSNKQQFNYHQQNEYLSRRYGNSDENLETEFAAPRSRNDDSLTSSTTENSYYRSIRRNKKEISNVVASDGGYNKFRQTKKNRRQKIKRISPQVSSSRIKMKLNENATNSDDAFGEKLSKSRGSVWNQSRKRKGDVTNQKSWSSVAVIHDEISHKTTTIHDKKFNRAIEETIKTTTKKPQTNFERNDFPRNKIKNTKESTTSAVVYDKETSRKSLYDPPNTLQYGFTPAPVTAVPALTTPSYFNHFIPPKEPLAPIKNKYYSSDVHPSLKFKGYVAPDLYGQHVPRHRRKPAGARDVSGHYENYYSTSSVDDPFYPSYEEYDGRDDTVEKYDDENDELPRYRHYEGEMSRNKKQPKALHLTATNNNEYTIDDGHHEEDRLINDHNYETSQTRVKNKSQHGINPLSTTNNQKKKKNKNNHNNNPTGFVQFSLGGDSSHIRGSDRINRAKSISGDRPNRLIDSKTGTDKNLHEPSFTFLNKADEINRQSVIKKRKPQNDEPVYKSMDKVNLKTVHRHPSEYVIPQSVYKPKPSLSFVNFRDASSLGYDTYDNKYREETKKRKISKSITQLSSKHSLNINTKQGPTVRPYGVPFQYANNNNNVAIRNPAAYSATSSSENEDVNNGIAGNSVYDHQISGSRGKQSRAPNSNEISYLERIRPVDDDGLPIDVTRPGRYHNKGPSKVKNGFATFPSYNTGYRVSKICKPYHSI